MTSLRAGSVFAVSLSAALAACGPAELEVGSDVDEGDDLVNADQFLSAGCPASRPTSIGGYIIGSDDYSVRAVVGVHMIDAQRRDVDVNGNVCDVDLNNCNGKSRYGHFVKFNENDDEFGIHPSVPGKDRFWSICVSAKVVATFWEGYPRGSDGKTNLTKYGETMSNRLNVTAGQTLRYNMRFPRRFEYNPKGNTGNVNGWATCHGQPTPVTRLNAWTNESSSTCGIRAYRSGGNIGNANGYWKSDGLAAGQCGRDYQIVNVVAHVNCNGGDMHKTIPVKIYKGKTVGAVNFHFP